MRDQALRANEGTERRARTIAITVAVLVAVVVLGVNLLGLARR